MPFAAAGCAGADLFAELGLEPMAAETRIVHLTEKGPGFDFLGLHQGWVRAQGRTGSGKVSPSSPRWSADEAMQHARDRIRWLTERHTTWLRVDVVMRGHQPVPARQGRVLPLRKLVSTLPQDQGRHGDAPGRFIAKKHRRPWRARWRVPSDCSCGRLSGCSASRARSSYVLTGRHCEHKLDTK